MIFSTVGALGLGFFRESTLLGEVILSALNTLGYVMTVIGRVSEFHALMALRNVSFYSRLLYFYACILQYLFFEDFLAFGFFGKIHKEQGERGLRDGVTSVMYLFHVVSQLSQLIFYVLRRGCVVQVPDHNSIGFVLLQLITMKIAINLI